MDKYYLDILQEWEDRVAAPAIYEHVDTLFPKYSFRRVRAGDPKDHWASRYKIDLSLPRYRNAEKTVVYRSEMRFREQGDWDNSISVMDKYMQDVGLTNIYEAYKDVSSRLGLAMPLPGDKHIADQIAVKARRSALIETLVDYFEWNLDNNRSAKASACRTYLKNVRGISRQQAATFRLGFVPDWNKVVRYVTIDKHFAYEDLDRICGVMNGDNFTPVGKTHVLSIPYECGGEIKGFLFRRIDDAREGPKYMANADLDRKTVFFNIPFDSDPKDIIVVEGELDALKASAEDIPNVVAIGGSEISGERRRQIEDAIHRRGAKRITLCLDLDERKDGGGPNLEARHSHLMKSIHTIKDVSPDFEEIYVALFDEPCDPDQFIRERGGEAFRHLLDSAVPYWKYLYDYHSSRQA